MTEAETAVLRPVTSRPPLDLLSTVAVSIIPVPSPASAPSLQASVSSGRLVRSLETLATSTRVARPAGNTSEADAGARRASLDPRSSMSMSVQPAPAAGMHRSFSGPTTTTTPSIRDLVDSRLRKSTLGVSSQATAGTHPGATPMQGLAATSEDSVVDDAEPRIQRLPAIASRPALVAVDPAASSTSAKSPFSPQEATAPPSMSTEEHPRSAPMIISHPPVPSTSLFAPPLRHVQSSPHLQQYSSSSSSSLDRAATAHHDSAMRSTFRTTPGLPSKADTAAPVTSTSPPASATAAVPIGAGRREIVTSNHTLPPIRSFAHRLPPFRSQDASDPVGPGSSGDTGLPTPLSAALVAPLMGKRHSLGGPLEGAARAVKRKPSFSLQAEHIYPSGGVVTVSAESVLRNSNGKGARLRQELAIGEEDEVMTELDPEVKPEPASPAADALASLASAGAVPPQHPLTPGDPPIVTSASKRRRVTISDDVQPFQPDQPDLPNEPETPCVLNPPEAGAPHTNSNPASASGGGSATKTQARAGSSREPISPLIIGFTQRGDVMAQQQLAAAQKVKEDQERLIQMRRMGSSSGNPAPTVSAPTTRRLTPGKGRGRAKTQGGMSIAKNPFTSSLATVRSMAGSITQGTPSTTEAMPSIVPSPSGLANRRGVAEKVRPLALSTSNSGETAAKLDGHRTAVARPAQGSPESHFEAAARSAPIGGRFFQSTTATGEVVKTPQIAKYAFTTAAPGPSSSIAAPVATGPPSDKGIAIPSLPSLPSLGTAGVEGAFKSIHRPSIVGSASQPQTAVSRFPLPVSQAPPPTPGPSRLQPPPPQPYRFGGPTSSLVSPTVPQPVPIRAPPLSRRASLAHLSFGGHLPSRETFMQPFETLFDCLNDAVILKNNFEDNLKRSADHLAIMERSSQTVEQMVDEKIQALSKTQTRELQLLESRIERLEAEIEADRGRPLPALKKLPPIVESTNDGDATEDDGRGYGTAARLAARLGRLEKESRR